MPTELQTAISQFPLEATVDRLVAQVETEGWHLFARIDHAALARKQGMQLRPTVLLLLGNPKIGTRLMQDNQLAAIDLPIKLLIWQDASERVSIAWNDFGWLRERHRLQDEATLGAIRQVIERVVAAATGGQPA